MLATFLQGGALSLTHLHLRNVQLPTVCPSTWVLPALKYLYFIEVDFGLLKMLLERCPTLECLIYTSGSSAAPLVDKGLGALALQNLPRLRRLSLPVTDLQWANLLKKLARYKDKLTLQAIYFTHLARYKDKLTLLPVLGYTGYVRIIRIYPFKGIYAHEP
jgi:hypothetical protein